MLPDETANLAAICRPDNSTRNGAAVFIIIIIIIKQAGAREIGPLISYCLLSFIATFGKSVWDVFRLDSLCIRKAGWRDATPTSISGRFDVQFGTLNTQQFYI